MLNGQLKNIKEKIRLELLPKDPLDERNIVLEVNILIFKTNYSLMNIKGEGRDRWRRSSIMGIRNLKDVSKIC